MKSAGGGCLPDYAKNMLKSACLKYLAIYLIDAIAKFKKVILKRSKYALCD